MLEALDGFQLQLEHFHCIQNSGEHRHAPGTQGGDENVPHRARALVGTAARVSSAAGTACRQVMSSRDALAHGSTLIGPALQGGQRRRRPRRVAPVTTKRTIAPRTATPKLRKLQPK